MMFLLSPPESTASSKIPLIFSTIAVLRKRSPVLSVLNGLLEANKVGSSLFLISSIKVASSAGVELMKAPPSSPIMVPTINVRSKRARSKRVKRGSPSSGKRSTRTSRSVRVSTSSSSSMIPSLSLSMPSLLFSSSSSTRPSPSLSTRSVSLSMKISRPGPPVTVSLPRPLLMMSSNIEPINLSSPSPPRNSKSSKSSDSIDRVVPSSSATSSTACKPLASIMSSPSPASIIKRSFSKTRLEPKIAISSEAAAERDTCTPVISLPSVI